MPVKSKPSGTHTRDKIKQLESRIAELEQEKFMFQGLLDTIPDHIYFKDRKSRFMKLSKALMDWFGAKTGGDVIGKTDFDIFSDEHARQAYEDEQNIIRTGIPVINKEEKETWEDGRVTWVSTSKVPMQDKQGRIMGIVGISHNITEKKETEAKLKKYRENLEESKKQTDIILSNVEEGLFLLNDDLTIASQYSRELRNILEEKKIANRNLMDILQNKIDPEILEATRQYLEFLFNDEYDEKMLKDLNPLYQMEMLIHKKKKYLTFNFNRIKKQRGTQRKVIVTVEDVTKEIMLTHSLEEQKAETQRKMDWMLCILNIEPGMLREFIASVHEEMTQVDHAFHQLLDSRKENEVLNRLYRSLHTIKGNASLLELDFLADQAHHAEDVVAQIKDKMKLVTKDRKDLQNQIDAIHKTYNELQELINHIARIHDHFRPKRNHEQKQLIISIERLIATVSKGYHKKVKFDYRSFDIAGMPFKHRLLVRDILIQLARNSVYHGIESPSQRRQEGKPETGLIRLTGDKKNSFFVIGFHDDGKGIHTAELKKKALESGKWNRDQIAGWTEKDMINTIFEPGITTADKTDLTAGRGIGLDLIRQKISRAGGDISVETEPGRGTTFTVVLPVNDRQPESVLPVSPEEPAAK